MIEGISWSITGLFFVALIYIIIKFRNEEEPYSILKVIGYFFLAGFRFSINTFHIPLGFILFYLFFRNPKKNRRAKRYAAALGLAAFIFGLLQPQIAESYLERTRMIEAQTKNLYEMDFQKHWNSIMEELDIIVFSPWDVRLEQLRVQYKLNGELTLFRYELIWPANDGKIHHAMIDFNETYSKFEVRESIVEEWIQYDRLISAELLFQQLGQIPIKEISPKGEYAYYGLSFLGERGSYIIDSESTYQINGSEITPYTGEDNFIGYQLTTYGMIEYHTENSSYGESAGYQSYVFDASY